MNWIDMDRQDCVQYCPPEAIEDPKFYRNFTKDGRLNINAPLERMGEIAHYFAEAHIVFDLNDMVRYIRFRDKLHDLCKKLVSWCIRSSALLDRSKPKTLTGVIMRSLAWSVTFLPH